MDIFFQAPIPNQVFIVVSYVIITPLPAILIAEIQPAR